MQLLPEADPVFQSELTLLVSERLFKAIENESFGLALGFLKMGGVFMFV